MLGDKIISFNKRFYRRKKSEWHFYDVQLVFRKMTLKLYKLKDFRECCALNVLEKQKEHYSDETSVYNWGKGNKAIVFKDLEISCL